MIIEERLSPFLADMKRRHRLGLRRTALEMCKGLVIGLYRLRDEDDHGVLQHASDFPIETATHVVSEYRRDVAKHAGRKRTGAVLGQKFIEECIPEWAEAFDGM